MGHVCVPLDHYLFMCLLFICLYLFSSSNHYHYYYKSQKRVFLTLVYPEGEYILGEAVRSAQR